MYFAECCGQASVVDVCKEWGISKSHGYRILNRWQTEESIVSRHLRDARTSKPQSISASSTQKERIITSYRTVSSTRNPSLTIFPYIWTVQAIQWRELWTTKVCMPHSLLLSHDKFMLHKLRPPRFAMSCNSTKKTRKKDPLVNSPITNRLITFGVRPLQ